MVQLPYPGWGEDVPIRDACCARQPAQRGEPRRDAALVAAADLRRRQGVRNRLHACAPSRNAGLPGRPCSLPRRRSGDAAVRLRHANNRHARLMHARGRRHASPPHAPTNSRLCTPHVITRQIAAVSLTDDRGAPARGGPPDRSAALQHAGPGRRATLSVQPPFPRLPVLRRTASPAPWKTGVARRAHRRAVAVPAPR